MRSNNGEDLGKAIYYVMDRADMYVRVPAEHEKRVREFVALLDAKEGD